VLHEHTYTALKFVCVRTTDISSEDVAIVSKHVVCMHREVKEFSYVVVYE
jgi:hypothetical protein